MNKDTNNNHDQHPHTGSYKCDQQTNSNDTTCTTNVQAAKIAVVTGASRGIGQAIAKKLAQNGIMVIGTATTEQGAKGITEELAEYNPHGMGVVLDVTSATAINNFANDISKQVGTISILINNAGITKDNLFLRMNEHDWDNVLETNLKSVFLVTKAFIRGMVNARYGRIINISSVVGYMGNPGQINYASSKAGLTAFTQSLAKELGSRNITANCVAPGFIETSMTDKLSPAVKQKYIDSIPLGKLGNVTDIANCVKFLVSEEADYITGTTIHVNGGLYM